jgi:hypothetical protein
MAGEPPVQPCLRKRTLGGGHIDPGDRGNRYLLEVVGAPAAG